RLFDMSSLGTCSFSIQNEVQRLTYGFGFPAPNIQCQLCTVEKIVEPDKCLHVLHQVARVLAQEHEILRKDFRHIRQIAGHIGGGLLLCHERLKLLLQFSLEKVDVLKRNAAL